MNTLSTVLEVLKTCHQAFPTKEARHTLTYNQDTEKIELTIYSNGKWWSFSPGDRDLDYIHNGIKFMKEYIEAHG